MAKFFPSILVRGSYRGEGDSSFDSPVYSRNSRRRFRPEIRECGKLSRSNVRNPRIVTICRGNPDDDLGFSSSAINFISSRFARFHFHRSACELRKEKKRKKKRKTLSGIVVNHSTLRLPLAICDTTGTLSFPVVSRLSQPAFYINAICRYLFLHGTHARTSILRLFNRFTTRHVARIPVENALGSPAYVS